MLSEGGTGANHCPAHVISLDSESTGNARLISRMGHPCSSHCTGQDHGHLGESLKEHRRPGAQQLVSGGGGFGF